MKEDDLYQKNTRKYDVTNVTLPFWQKSKDTLVPKNTLNGNISGTAEKDDIHPRKNGISFEVPR